MAPDLNNLLIYIEEIPSQAKCFMAAEEIMSIFSVLHLAWAAQLTTSVMKPINPILEVALLDPRFGILDHMSQSGLSPILSKLRLGLQF